MKVRGSSWKFALLLLTGIIVAAQLLFIIHWRWRFWQIQHWKNELPPDWVAIEMPSKQQMQEHRQKINILPPFPPSASSTNKPMAASMQMHRLNGGGRVPSQLIVQELICARDQEHRGGCYVVMDGPDSTEKGFNRFLIMEPAKHGLMGEVALKFPILYKFIRQNSRQWPVLTNRLQWNYQRVLVAQPFLTQTFTPTNDLRLIGNGKTRRILCLGLRASAINNFFANLSVKYDVTVVEPEQPLRYVAEKWFGFQENEHHRIFVDNPAFYMSARAKLIAQNGNAARKPKHFDFVLVDLCMGLGTTMPDSCPVSEFVKDEKIVLALSKNLADNGTIVVHFFTPAIKTPNDDNNTKQTIANSNQRQALQLYKKFFKTCYFVFVGSHSLLTCTQRALLPFTRANYMSAFRSLPKEIQIYPNKQEQPTFLLDSEVQI